MSHSDKKHILRAWRDADYYDSLTDAERAALPDSPASVMELDDATLAFITGGDTEATCPSSPAPTQRTCLFTPCGTSHCCA
ncbi:mersacidin/lichenicidin family type 2 lantibiotic [Comamonas sp. JC664]|uniref:mersacidin/lichenicidin family type 2 lantibiotic n=1 Tax=Comamonas sp. JC664 TaxID=2801917 RepID=UPI00174A5922|nr:mersacidin/lichenicidin family type 2 lantibiotic [Comamonas sp. JC664]MBL0699224.1 mersacidin/lichenicidin family type 2 lantibiotic [Comamonas sp. JC664]GHH02115.1 hypothetical protein GCM10012319_70370 [Comamonas sp. KCTC 72670]